MSGSAAHSPRFWWTAGLAVARTYGIVAARGRAAHEIRRRLGLFRERPANPLGPRAGVPLFTLDLDAIRNATSAAIALERGRRVAGGEFQAFRCAWRDLPSAAGWRRYPRGSSASEGPWWTVETLSRELGDVKDLWDPARFAWAYDLARAFAVERDPKYPQALWRALADWWSVNPPFLGIHWACGQEVAIRAIALLHAEAAFQEADDVPAAPLLVAVFGASGERIEDGLGYALSQRNNHGISEAVGLVCLGARLTGIHPAAPDWLERGAEVLEILVRQQFADDGWYIQHSFNYARMAVDQLVVAQRFLRCVGRGLSPGAVERIAAAVRLLTTVMEPSSGRVPRYGNDDGSYVLPLSLGEYADYRPCATAASAAFDLPWPSTLTAASEPLAWLGASSLRRGEPLPAVVRGSSGWVSVRRGRMALFLRAGTYASRPGHIDPLHIDVRADGKPLLVDPGSYSYNAPEAWGRDFAGAEAHNGPSVLGRDVGVRGPRFLWLSFPDAKIVEVREDTDMVTIVARIEAVAERRIKVTEAAVAVEDEVLNRPGQIRVAWLLHPDAPRGCLQVEGAESVREVRGDPGSVLGWEAPCYGARRAATAVLVERHMDPGVALHTIIRAPSRPAGLDL